MRGVRRTGWLAALALAGCSTTVTPVAQTEGPTPTPSPSPAVTAEPSPQPTPSASPRASKVRAQAVSRASLLPFTSCTDLLTRVKREALTQVGPYGLPYGGAVMVAGVRAAMPAAAAAEGSGSTDSGGGTPAFSATNNQEAGVDEADLVKTDGRLMVVLRQQPPGVQVVDVSGTPELRGFLPLPQGMHGGQLLLVGSRAVVVGTLERRAGERYVSSTHVLVVSLADPSRPRTERTFDVEGWTTAAREIGGRVLLVTQSSPDIAWAQPRDGTRGSEAAALRENKRRIRHSPLHAWLPSVKALRTGRTYKPACSDGLRTQSSSGTATTTLVSLDPASDVPGAQAVVEGSGAVVYASTRSVYVTTSPWEAQTSSSRVLDENDVATSVHRFDVSDPAEPAYRASGSVPGSLVGQYAMSEHEGHLRVATTLGRTWAMQGETEPPSDNLVTVLAEQAERLVKVGQVRGLGRGERIYGVRFQGALGYVVTFRQTDPLYVLDLADPSRPLRRGELHVTGYSSYLHPLGDGLLLGIGQEVAGNQRKGTQISTFDVGDPRSPRLHDREVFPQASSNAESDPHALLWWPATRDVVVPLTVWSDGRRQPFQGALVLHVGKGGALTEAGRVEHPQSSAPYDGSMAPEPCCHGSGIVRSVVVDDLLLTLSDGGVMATSLDTLEERAWLPYR